MTRVVKSRDYRTVVGYIPDEFTISVTGTEEDTVLTYTENYRQSEAFFKGLSKTVTDKMKESGWETDIAYSQYGKITATWRGSRKECLGKMFLELTLQAKCFYDNDDLQSAFDDIEVRETWREDNL